MAHSTLPHDALTQHDRAIAGLRASRIVRRHLIQTSDGRRHSRRHPKEVIAALGESFWWERNARQLGVDVPRGLEVRYHDLAKLASLCGIEIAELLRAAGPPTETSH